SRYKIRRERRRVRAYHSSPGYRAFNHRNWTALSFQDRAPCFHGSCLPVALPASLAIAHAAPHLNVLSQSLAPRFVSLLRQRRLLIAAWGIAPGVLSNL